MLWKFAGKRKGEGVQRLNECVSFYLDGKGVASSQREFLKFSASWCPT